MSKRVWTALPLVVAAALLHCGRAVQDLGDDGTSSPNAADDAQSDASPDAPADAPLGDVLDGAPDGGWGCGVAAPVTLADGPKDRAWIGVGPPGEIAAIGVGSGPDGDGVYARRFDLAGLPLGAPVRVAPATTADGPARRVAATFTGSSYAVVWPTFESGGSPNGASFHFALLDATGAVRQTTSFAPAAVVATVVETRIISTGTAYLVVWQDTFRVVHVFVLDTSGKPTGPDQALGIDPSNGFSVAWTGAELGLVYAHEHDVRFVRVSANGTVIGAPVTVATFVNTPTTPELAWLGDRYGSATVNQDDAPSPVTPEQGTSYIFVFGPDGSPRVAPQSFGTAATPTYDTGEHPLALALAGDTLGLAFADAREGAMNEIYFARATTAGVRIGADVRVTVTSTANGGRSEQPFLSPAAGGGVVAYRTYTPSGFVTMMKSPCP